MSAQSPSDPRAWSELSTGQRIRSLEVEGYVVLPVSVLLGDLMLSGDGVFMRTTVTIDDVLAAARAGCAKPNQSGQRLVGAGAARVQEHGGRRGRRRRHHLRRTPRRRAHHQRRRESGDTRLAVTGLLDVNA